MIGRIATLLFDTFGGQALAAAGGVLIVCVWYVADRQAVYQTGARDAQFKYQISGRQMADRMAQARDAAGDEPNPLDRLQQFYCRDCGR